MANARGKHKSRNRKRTPKRSKGINGGGGRVSLTEIEKVLLGKGFVGGMPLFVKRVLPDPKWQEAIVAACRTFETNAAALVSDYRKRVDGLPVTERIDYDLKVA